VRSPERVGFVRDIATSAGDRGTLQPQLMSAREPHSKTSDQILRIAPQAALALEL
jgi:hypothetical protein